MAPAIWGDRYGNTWPVVRTGIVAMALIGGILDAILIGTMFVHHTLYHWPLLFVPLLAFPGMFYAVCVPSMMSSIWIGGGRVRHVFLDRYVLTDLPAADFEHMLLSPGYRYLAGGLYRRFGFSDADFDKSPTLNAVTLYFRYGHRIRFVAAHMRILRSLKDALIAAKQHA